MKKVARFVSVGVTAAVVGGVGLTSAASAYSIYNTGPFSNNGIYSTSWNNYVETNWNNVYTNNLNNQWAHSGDATVLWNTYGGSAISGSASNWNNTSTNINLWNY